MKNYINIILFTSALLIIFPFLGFSEIIENFYVIILAFVIATSTLLLRHKSGLIVEEDEDSSLQEYVKELQDRFKEQDTPVEEKKKRISDVTIPYE
jgi:hypothetical protein